MELFPDKLWAKILVLGAYAISAYFAFRMLGVILPALAPFIIAWIIAAVLQKPIGFVSNALHIKRGVVAFAITALFLSVSGTLLFTALRRGVYELAQLLGSLGEKSDTVIGNIADWIEKISNKLPFVGSGSPDLSNAVKNGITDSLGGIISTLTKEITSILGTLLQSVPQIILFTVEGIISSFYFAVDYNKVKSFISGILPSELRLGIFALGNHTKKTASEYLRASFIMMLIMFCLVTIGLLLLGVRYAVLLSLLISFVDFLPVLGIGAVLAPWGVFCLLTGNTARGLGLLALWGICEAIRSFSEPHLVSRSIGLHPIVTLVCIYCGYKFFGIWGMILCPVAVTVVLRCVKNGIFKPS